MMLAWVSPRVLVAEAEAVGEVALQAARFDIKQHDPLVFGVQFHVWKVSSIIVVSGNNPGMPGSVVTQTTCNPSSHRS